MAFTDNEENLINLILEISEVKNQEVENTYFLIILTRRLLGFEILNNATLILEKWLVSRHFVNIFHYLDFSEEYL